MFRPVSVAIILTLLAACASTTQTNAPDPEEVLSKVVTAMGAGDLESITFTGNAWQVRDGFRQTLDASPPWNFRNFITEYVRTIDLKNSKSLASGDTFARNLFFDPPSEVGTYVQNVSIEQNSWRQQLEYWLTPWGFLSGASVNGATAAITNIDGERFTVITWQSPETVTAPSGLNYTVKGYINRNNLIEKVETWAEDGFMGDLNIAMLYSDYRLMDGVMVPSLMEQTMAGGGVFGVSVFDATANPENLSDLMTPPEARGGFFFGGGGEPPTELVKKLDAGVYLVVGGYVALVAEFDDHLVVFEGGQSPERGQQIIAEIKKNISTKPIKYIVNSHPHSDHTAGLAPFIREGATLITHENNVEFLSMALTTPRTLLGEATLQPTIMGVGDTTVLEDSSMKLELHHIPNGHSDGMLVALLPNQGILFQADFTLPQAGAKANPFVVTLATIVDKKGLNFERYYAVHAAQEEQTKTDLMKAIGK